MNITFSRKHLKKLGNDVKTPSQQMQMGNTSGLK